jgi:dihydropteroate synthase
MQSFKSTLKVGKQLLDLSTPRVMGILNVTPDSFFDGGKYSKEEQILAQVKKMLAEGASFIDIGGYSSRPGAVDIPEKEEANRVISAIRLVLEHFPDTLISVDTFRANIAQKAVESGAVMINDISGGEEDPKMFEVVADLKVPYILMHRRGTTRTMTKLTEYEHLIKDICLYFSKKVRQLQVLGQYEIILDVGFGFAKNTEQNYHLLHHLELFKCLGLPLLAGVSRKSMIYKTLGVSPEEALNGTSVLNALVLQAGASILRVHDVKEALQTIHLINAWKQAFKI